MAISDILICTDPSTAGESRLQLALNIARANKAYLVAGYAMPEEQGSVARSDLRGVPPIPSDGMIGAAAEGLSQRLDPRPSAIPQPQPQAALEEAAEQQFRNELQQYGVEGEWHVIAPGDTDSVIELAKSVDMTVLGQLSPDTSAGRAAWIRPANVVVAAGRPILVVPYAGAFAAVGKRVVLAWDGTREAARALNDALPLLEAAEEVIAIFVASRETGLEREKLSLERVARHLRRHAIEIRVEETLRGDMAVSDIILSRAADLEADLIVAGAYHHSQLREALIGGVSHDLLEHMTIPVLLSH